jgi:phage terminase large subunit
MVNSEIASMLKYKGYAKEAIIADSAEPKSIEELKRAGIMRIKPAAKGKDSILNGIQLIQDYKIIVHPKCENTILELSNYIWDNKDGILINKPIDDYNHLLDALRYAMEAIKKKPLSITDKSFYNI